MTNYYLIWHGEIIDETTSHTDAVYLVQEYTLSHKGVIRVTRRPTPKQLKEWNL